MWSYGKNCRIDALLVLPDEGRPVAAFELDSGYHDQPKARLRDEMKDAIFRLVGMPFFRLRIQSPHLSPTGTLEPVDDRHNGATA